MNGPKSSRASGSSEKPTIVVVRPWKLPAATMIFARSVRHALHPVAPLAGHLDAGLDRLGAGVHRQHHLLAGELGELRAERAELVVVERAAGERDPVELRGARRRPGPGAGARSSAPSSRRAVEVAAAVDVGDPGALGVRDHHRQRVVVVRGVRLDQAGVERRCGLVGGAVMRAAPACSTSGRRRPSAARRGRRGRGVAALGERAPRARSPRRAARRGGRR